MGEYMLWEFFPMMKKQLVVKDLEMVFANKIREESKKIKQD